MNQHGVRTGVLVVFCLLLCGAGVLAASFSKGGHLTSRMNAAAVESGFPVISLQPVSQVIAAGKQFNVNVIASSPTPVKYTWYRNGQPIAGYNAYMWYVPVARADADAGTYYAVVTNDAGSVTSDTATIAVADSGAPTTPVTPPAPSTPPASNAPVVATQPVSVSVAVGKQFSLSVTVSSTVPVNYAWYHNGKAIPGWNASVWYVASATAEDAGTYYVTANSSGGSATSASATVSVDNSPAPAPTPAPSPEIAPAPTPPVTPPSDQTPPPAPAPVPPVSVPPPSPWPTLPPPSWSALPLLSACGSCDGGPKGLQNINDFAALMGRQPDIVMVWGWFDTANNFMYSFKYLSDLWPASTRLLWTVPMIQDNTTFAYCYRGNNDAAYRSAAQTIAARDPNAIIRIGQEMNGNWETWSMDGPAGSSAEFAQCYRHIVDIFRSVSGSSAFDWNPGIGSWAGLDGFKTYPGDDYVDYVSYDMYEDKNYLSGSATERWAHFLTVDGRGLDYLAAFTNAHHKKIGIDEWGTNYDDGSFIRNMHDWMIAHNVSYQMYWNSEAAFSGSFAVHPANGALYKQLFGKN